jgi:hypothetical protein
MERAEGFVERVKRHGGGVPEEYLAGLLVAETGPSSAGRFGLQDALRALGCDQDGDVDALSQILGRGGPGGGPAPRVMALGLLQHLASQLAGRDGRGAGLGALAAASPFVAAFGAELQRARRLLAGAHDELLARLAALGEALPPASAEAAAGGGHPRAGAAAAELEACAALRVAADRAAEDLVALDAAAAEWAAALARLAAAYDAALLRRAAEEAAAAGGGGCGGSSSGDDEAWPAGGGRRGSLQPRWWRRRWAGGSGAQGAEGASSPFDGAPIAAVVSHSAPGQQGKYVAGEARCSRQGVCLKAAGQHAVRHAGSHTTRLDRPWSSPLAASFRPAH